MREKQFTLFVLSIAIGLTVVLGRCSPTPASSEAMSAKQPAVTPSAGTTALPPTLGLQTLTDQGGVGLRPYADAVLGTAFDVPAEWEVQGFQGAEAHVVALDMTGTPQAVLTFSVVGAFDALGSTLAEVRRGAWGPSSTMCSRCTWASLRLCA